MCFLWIWEQTAIISLYGIKWLVFITETECVYCAVRAGPLNTTQVNISLQKPESYNSYGAFIANKAACSHALWTLHESHTQRSFNNPSRILSGAPLTAHTASDKRNWPLNKGHQAYGWRTMHPTDWLTHLIELWGLFDKQPNCSHRNDRWSRYSPYAPWLLRDLYEDWLTSHYTQPRSTPNLRIYHTTHTHTHTEIHVFSYINGRLWHTQKQLLPLYPHNLFLISWYTFN